LMAGETSEDPKGYALTLSKLNNSALRFDGTRLLAFSACSTATQAVASDGEEMDSLGMIAQQKDAQAVLASLWDVNDESTSRLMSEFYAQWLKHPSEGKGEALRQAQMTLLHGSGKPAGGGPSPGNPPPASAAPASDYSHPHYWAPFVLIGNFQ
jgi:CHAT domain-containing protein